ncbi:MAG TPA: hypothetical protein DDY98_08535 [Ruminococcaceae bacterium]|nr:hypothetical protein [Oscillospiraceae bacterium]
MNRERIGIEARLCQCGHRRQAVGLRFFEKGITVLRLALLVAWLVAYPKNGFSLPWIVLACFSGVFFALSLLLSSCGRLLKNRWMKSLRCGQAVTITDLMVDFTVRDIVLAVRIEWYYRWRLTVRAVLFGTIPLALAWFIVWRLIQQGVSVRMFTAYSVGLVLFFSVSLLCFLSAWEALKVSISLLADRESFERRKNDLVRLDKDCFFLLKFSLSFLFLPENVRFQAKVLFALHAAEKPSIP